MMRGRRRGSVAVSVTAFLTVFVPLVLAPSVACAGDASVGGLGRPAGIAAGAATACVVGLVAGAVAASSDAKEVSLPAAAGIAIATGLVGAIIGSGIIGSRSDGSEGIVVPMVGGAIGAIAGAVSFWAVAPERKPPADPSVVAIARKDGAMVVFSARFE